MRIIISIISFMFTTSCFALHQSHLPQSLQTKQTKPVLRRLSVSLPLAHTEEWLFDSKKNLLKGKLSLTITHHHEQQTIIIFNQGHFSPGWHAMPLGRTASHSQSNFKFVSTKKYLTAPGDKLRLNLTTTQDLLGTSAFFSGMLAKGHYTSYGTYSGLTDKPDLTHSKLATIILSIAKTKRQQQHLFNSLYHKAFLADWRQQWPITIVNHHGWMSPQQVPFK